MQASTWLERAQAALRAQGIPEPQQLRCLEELQDHLTDLQEAQMRGTESPDLERVMGAPEPLAEALADTYRRERFLARHLWLAGVAFTLGPPLVHWLLTISFTTLLMLGLFCLLQTPPGALSDSLDAAFNVLFVASSILTAAGVTAWFCLAARRNRLSWRMSLLGSVALALGTSVLALELLESEAELWILVLATATTSLAAWYGSAWRGQRWRQEPISLSQRYPVLVSGLGSVVAATLCLCGYLMLTGLLLFFLVDVIGRPRQGVEYSLLALSCNYVPFAIAACLCWRMTQRCPHQRWYSLAACIGVAIFAAVFTAGVSSPPDGQATMHFGLGLGSAFRWSVLAQFFTPLAMWGALALPAWQPLRLRMS